MMLGTGAVFLILSILILVLSRREKGPWKYKGIFWMIRMGKRNGRELPEWLRPEILLRTWILLAAGSSVMVLWGIGSFLTEGEQITRLFRPSYGSGSQREELIVEWKDGNGNTGKDSLAVDVQEKNLTLEEKAKIFYEIKEKLGQAILGNNQTADRVDQPLVLLEKLDDYPASISWISSDPSCVDWEGNLGENIPTEGKLVCLIATIRLQEEEEMYYQYLQVFPPVADSREQILKLVEKENQDGEENWLTLPKELGDRKLIWKRDGESMAGGITILLLLCPILLLIRDKQIAEEKKKAERQQMMQDYPEILSKLTLLLSAGINLRKAMERIGQDYVNYSRTKGERKAYEVIVEVCREMDHGISEKEAYERIGERCGVLPYRTFSALLIQHLQKGSKGMEQMLEEEALKAQEMRQQQARILGEQASTKLLFPMVLMLLVVFVILLVPAWISFA